MQLMPKRVKYRKSQRGSMKGIATSGDTVCFGEYGLKSLGCCWMKANQIEAARIILSRRLRRGGRLWIRVFPDKPVSKKPAETRMGKGKAETSHWVAVIKRGKVLFEIGGVPEEFARESFKLIAYKFPIRTKFLKRR